MWKVGFIRKKKWVFAWWNDEEKKPWSQKDDWKEAIVRRLQ